MPSLRSLLFLLGLVAVLTTAGCPHQGNYGLAPKPFRIGITGAIGDISATHAVELVFVGSGDSGCVYDVLGGLLHAETPLVAKTPNARSREINQIEHEALLDIGELYMVGQSIGDTRDWLFIKKHYGVPLRKTAAFLQRYPRGHNMINTPDAIMECETSMNAHYRLIVDKWLEYIESSEKVRKLGGLDGGGWFQSDLNDGNWLWPNLEEVNIIDWDNAMLVKFPNTVVKNEWVGR
ncbi:hypothetical protein FRB93_013427 [Tulasnella sp. JGI-2019a]|nr:hypothetical protein FRB93_013427 [Tulasnella sp. JGI-2019a]